MTFGLPLLLSAGTRHVRRAATAPMLLLLNPVSLANGALKELPAVKRVT